MTLAVLYHDNHLLAVDKPAGLFTQESGTGRSSLEEQAREWVRVEKNKPGQVFLHAVHRLDTVVSGVVLFARTSKALSRLNEQMCAGETEKIYQAQTEGLPPQPEGMLCHWLRHGGGRAELARAGAEGGAKRCVLHYRTLERRGLESALLEIRLETGRYHQIRAQLAAMGCPVAGDVKYGARQRLPGEGIALHHFQLTVLHPVTRKPLILQAPLPALMRC
jgi:23S rRNA pseudouridine1911/1915/1917 synthase